ncbi:MAG TPA: FAD-dependent monooxygenase [Pseudonocardiaceae bacterium]|nr:FAD-dependent monooxygenase [Pseudonocardiaceae bacterium]
MRDRVSVLVVGAGLAGLASAVFLARPGVDVLPGMVDECPRWTFLATGSWCSWVWTASPGPTGPWPTYVIPEEAFLARFGIGPTGASLVRPDGVVAWRAVDAPGDPGPVLAGVLGRVLSLGV